VFHDRPTIGFNTTDRLLCVTCYFSCCRVTGDVHWSVPVGPGGTVGGLQWGSAADNSRIYVANNNYLSVTADLTNLKSVVNFPTTTNQLPPTSTDGGLAAAVDAYTGEILWTFANPTLHWDGTGKHAWSQAPMTVANGIVFYPSECQRLQ
jgi:polyvinyl alcohol dehydrogenase (cytochrome)